MQTTTDKFKIGDIIKIINYHSLFCKRCVNQLAVIEEKMLEGIYKIKFVNSKRDFCDGVNWCYAYPNKISLVATKLEYREAELTEEDMYANQ